MTESDLEHEAERWRLLSQSAALCAAEAQRVARSLELAERSPDGAWRVPGGTTREAGRARMSVRMIAALGAQLNT